MITEAESSGAALEAAGSSGVAPGVHLELRVSGASVRTHLVVVADQPVHAGAPGGAQRLADDAQRLVDDAQRLVDDEPLILTCPLTFTMFRDPVVIATGHTYERQAIENFWERKPLGNPLGGAPLDSPIMLINFQCRSQVDAWLDAHPRRVPHGWSSRSAAAESRSTVDQLSATSRRYEARDNDAKRAISAELARGSASVWILGKAPTLRGRERLRNYVSIHCLGEFEVCADQPLTDGRYVYSKREDESVMLWHVAYPHPMWVCGGREHLGRPLGAVHVRSDARLPEDIRSAWRVGQEAAPGIFCCSADEGQRIADEQRATYGVQRLPQIVFPAAVLSVVGAALLRSMTR